MSADGLCPDCDRPVPADAYTCPHCGQPLDVPKPARGIGPRRRRRGGKSGCAAVALVAVIVLFASCAAKKPVQTFPSAPPGGALVAFRKHVVAVELATTPDEWQQGLMSRKHLGRDAGMLFLFPSAQKTGFWMKDTLIPLQIAFLRRTSGQTYRVAALFEMTPCKADPCHIYDPKTSYDAALEVNTGWFTAHGVHVGSTGEVGRAPTPSP